MGYSVERKEVEEAEEEAEPSLLFDVESIDIKAFPLIQQIVQHTNDANKLWAPNETLI